jgi:signal transduction histidine kinase
MTASLKVILAAFKNLTFLALVLFIWLLFGMVYLDRFFQPFNQLSQFLMPWKEPDMLPAAASVEKRLLVMQGQLSAANSTAYYALLVMVASFALLCIYLTLIYQQKQRRSRENRLLLAKNQEIARRNEFIRYISATIGHEFKNNLGRIKRRIDLVSDLHPDVRARIDGNLDKLFSDIEIFKRISDERESGLTVFTKTDVRDVLIETAGQYSDLTDIVILDSKPIPQIFASQPLLKTAFENILDNAIKYKKPEQQRARITLSFFLDTDQNRKYVAVSFRDEGIGMDEQEADQCFYKKKVSRGGWGQGLSFAKYVIGLHAGKIRVGKEYTTKGKGTEIIMHLPFVEEELNV